MALSEEEALDELYAADPDDFTARRNELAKQLRAAGDAAAADRVKALKKPSRAAWAINRFSGDEAKLRKQLLDAGAGLRDAQERLVAGEGDRTEVREASERERAAVDKARDAVATISAEAGAQLSPAALERAVQTLHAVALDDDVRRDFERGRLTTDHEAVGLGGLDLAAAAQAGKGSRKPPGSKAGDSKKAQKLRDELTAAEAEVRELDRRQKQADLSVTAARDAAERAQRDLKHATRELNAAAGAAAKARERVEALRKRRR
jgi:chromosome segregation ATPase